MVKGINKRVIIVKAPENGLFDEAIFVVREDASRGITPEALLRQAQSTAGRYDARQRHPLLTRFAFPLYALLGAAVVGCAWGISALL